MKRQFVSTCYIFHDNQFLLLFHKKHQKWLPPGGHVESDETPPEAARREVREETGLEISFLHQENLWIEQTNAISIERPFSCLLEKIEDRPDEKAHEHIDFIYVATPIEGRVTEGTWFSIEEVEERKTDEELFFDTQETMRQILSLHSQQLLTRSTPSLNKSESFK